MKTFAQFLKEDYDESLYYKLLDILDAGKRLDVLEDELDPPDFKEIADEDDVEKAWDWVWSHKKKEYKDFFKKELKTAFDKENLFWKAVKQADNMGHFKKK